MWCGCVWEVDGYKGLCGVCRFLADKMGSKVAYQNGTFLREDDPRQQRSVVLPYDRRGGFRVSENLRIHLAIENIPLSVGAKSPSMVPLRLKMTSCHFPRVVCFSIECIDEAFQRLILEPLKKT